MQQITVRVRMDARTFRRFAVYDAFRVRRLARRPALFFLLMAGFSLAAFLSRREGSVLIGSVLIGIALLLPLGYFGSFLSEVGQTVRKLKLKEPKSVYTVLLHKEGVLITGHQRAGEQLTLSWRDVHALHRLKGALYLYAAPERAFILPSGQADAPDDEVEAFLLSHLPGDRVFPRP